MESEVLSARQEIKKGLSYTFLNLATPLVFYFTFHTWGAKPAIAVALAVTTLQVIAHIVLRIKPTPIFGLASGFTVVFGLIDMFVQNPRFFRLEPFAQNLIMGIGLMIAACMRFPVAVWFATSLPETVRPDLSKVPKSYINQMTLVAGVYLCLKAMIFFYLAFKVDLGELIVLRTVIGSGSLAILVLGEIAYRKLVLKDFKNYPKENDLTAGL